MFHHSLIYPPSLAKTVPAKVVEDKKIKLDLRRALGKSSKVEKPPKPAKAEQNKAPPPIAKKRQKSPGKKAQ
jgi:hypothetical protein